MKINSYDPKQFANDVAALTKGRSHEEVVELVIRTCGMVVGEACDEIEKSPVGFGRSDEGRAAAIGVIRRFVVCFLRAQVRREQ